MLLKNSLTAALLIIVCEHGWHKNSDASVCQDRVWEECSYSADQRVCECERFGPNAKGIRAESCAASLNTGGLQLLKDFRFKQRGAPLSRETHFLAITQNSTIREAHFLAITLETWPWGIFGH